MLVVSSSSNLLIQGPAGEEEAERSQLDDRVALPLPAAAANNLTLRRCFLPFGREPGNEEDDEEEEEEEQLGWKQGKEGRGKEGGVDWKAGKERRASMATTTTTYFALCNKKKERVDWGGGHYFYFLRQFSRSLIL